MGELPGLLATLLAAIGLYGVVAFTVPQCTREFGVHMALGANPARVRGMVLGQMLKMTVIGGALGLAASLPIGRVVQSLLFQWQGMDPMVLLVAGVTLSLAALSAGLVPAKRASRLDPVRALHHESRVGVLLGIRVPALPTPGRICQRPPSTCD